MPASLSATADDVSRAGLDAADVRKVADLAAENHKVLDEITEPGCSPAICGP
ncbi:hypothetical protein ACN6K9_005232 [Streptomyces sp. SAS_267]|uniref:hypothetical protein n=1 Tax=unclassified Streptomyces TaxID=2593676 RepID=UPI0036F92F28